VKRVPARQERAHGMWPSVVGNEQIWNAARLELAQKGFRSEQIERVIAVLRPTFKRGMPGEIAMKSIVEPLPMFTGGLTQMQWTFIVASGPRLFVTSDNPVVLMNAAALGDKRVELLFPVYSNVVLSARWRSGTDLTYTKASQRRVSQINKAVIASSTKHIYYHAPELWLAEQLGAA